MLLPHGNGNSVDCHTASINIYIWFMQHLMGARAHSTFCSRLFRFCASCMPIPWRLRSRSKLVSRLYGGADLLFSGWLRWATDQTINLYENGTLWYENERARGAPSCECKITTFYWTIIYNKISLGGIFLCRSPWHSSCEWYRFITFNPLAARDLLFASPFALTSFFATLFVFIFFFLFFFLNSEVDII